MNELAPRPSQQDWPLYGLVSLRDMLRFYADRFVNAMNLLVTIEKLIKADATDFWINQADFSAGRLDELADQLRGLNLPVAAKKAQDLAFVFRTPDPKAILADRFIEEIRSRLEDELEGRLLFYVSNDRDLFENPGKTFGKLAQDKFPEAAEDIESAGRCLALRQGAACVFHLMRAMEAALKIIGEKLGVNNTEKEWGKLLSDLHGKIEIMEKGEGRDEWSACHSNLYHVKQAWRNPTMHPKRTYTVEQADDVFRATAAFMRHLATLI